MEILEAARNGDFVLAKERFDEAIASGPASAKEVLQTVDRRGRSVAHYAAEYDEVMVIEWLYNMGVNLFQRDDMNKSPIEIAVLVDAKLKKKRKGEGEVLEFMKRVVLNPIQKIFYLESAESCDSVSSPADLAKLSDEELVEKFPYHNNMQALHVFSLCGKLEELKYLEQRGVDMQALDDDSNSALHFASNAELVSFLIKDCQLSPNQTNSSDGYTPAHSVIDRITMEELSESEGVSILSVLETLGADFRNKSDDQLTVPELAFEMLGDGPVFRACARNFSEAEIAAISISYQTMDNSEDEVSVASHDDKVIAEDEEESSGDEGSEDSV